jgi:hypothetical protein
MSFYTIFFFIICAILIWVTLRKKEIYPFSYYPMYSSPHLLGEINVFRIALKKDDIMVWWESEFYRYPEYAGRKLKQLWAARNNAGEKDVFLQLERDRLLILVLQIMQKEKVDIGRYDALCIVERRINGDLEPIDQLIETVLLNDLRNGLF